MLGLSHSAYPFEKCAPSDSASAEEDRCSKGYSTERKL